MGTTFAAGAAAVTIALFMGAAQHQTLERFDLAVRSYAALHQHVEARLPRQEVTPDTAMLRLAVDQVAAAMKAARPQARKGDIFDPDVRRLLRERIEQTLKVRGHDVADVLSSMEQEVARPAFRPRVNERFPPPFWATTWPCLLEVLPPLPDELQYRFVGRDLLLVDVHANLIVDILPRALPRPVAAPGAPR